MFQYKAPLATTRKEDSMSTFPLLGGGSFDASQATPEDFRELQDLQGKLKDRLPAGGTIPLTDSSISTMVTQITMLKRKMNRRQPDPLITPVFRPVTHFIGELFVYLRQGGWVMSSGLAGIGLFEIQLTDAPLFPLTSPEVLTIQELRYLDEHPDAVERWTSGVNYRLQKMAVREALLTRQLSCFNE
jgi:hypothetical protein